MNLLQITLLLASVITLVIAQQGPVPPRLSIPGAVPIDRRPQFRNNVGIRVRRPVLRQQTSNSIAPPIAPRIIDDPKPVTESTEDEINDPFIPQLLREQQQPQIQVPQQSAPQYPVQAPNFFNEPNSIQQDSPLQEEQPQPPRFIERPAPPSPPQPRQQPVNDFGSQRFAIERQPPQQRPLQAQPVRTRPSNREPRPQFEQARPRPNPIQARPIDQNNLNQEDYRPRKPVAQILRKYREENPDGSITWGYENDDGSFKEENIGMDCITKGTYGYVDPDGNKREYHYETGIKCDPNNRQIEGQDVERGGFINYEQNKAVLPNGLEIDLSTMGKKKSKRPGAVLQQPQQPYYRN